MLKATALFGYLTPCFKQLEAFLVKYPWSLLTLTVVILYIPFIHSYLLILISDTDISQYHSVPIHAVLE